jgi:hypothetical protein
MATRIHDAPARDALIARVDRLRADSQRQWGKMRVDQMLHHLNAALEMTLGRLTAERKPVGIPRPLLKLLVFNLPWPKGKAPTAPELIAADTYDFENERARLKQLIQEVGAKPIGGQWVDHPAFGPLSGRECSLLQHKHIDHHLRQFGA